MQLLRKESITFSSVLSNPTRPASTIHNGGSRRGPEVMHTPFPPPPPPRIRPVGFFTTYTNSKILTMIGWRIPTLYEVFVIQLSCNMSWLIWAITKKTIKGFLCLQIESLDLLPKFSGPPPPSNPYRC